MKVLEAGGSGGMKLFRLRNRRGVSLTLANCGASIVSLKTPDRHGRFADIVLGYADLASYGNAAKPSYFGSTIGRFANRIEDAAYRHRGRSYRLSSNQGRHCLHGGRDGWDRRLWAAEPVQGKNFRGLRFSLHSADGDGGFPGNVRAQALYVLNDDNELWFEFRASSDKATPINMTNHAYFNLRGEGNGTVLAHELWINAEGYTPVKANQIPTGEIAPLRGGPLDFRFPKAIGRDIAKKDPQLKIGAGYDLNYVLKKPQGPGSLSLAARASEAMSGRSLELWTEEPGLQFYAGNKLGAPYPRFGGFCLEPQHFPDSPNQANFPSTILEPGKTYRSKSILKF